MIRMLALLDKCVTGVGLRFQNQWLFFLVPVDVHVEITAISPAPWLPVCKQASHHGTKHVKLSMPYLNDLFL